MSETALHRLRVERNLSQSQLAARARIHPQALAKLERGERPIENIRFETALNLAKALEVSPEQLLG